MKSVIFATFLVASLLATSFVLVSGVNITWGYIGPYDRIIARDFVQHEANWFTKHKEIVNYPPKGHQSFRQLSAIRVLDLGGKKNFGYATLLKGGPGHFNSTIEVRSQARKPVNMTIEYFSRF
ncbi:uncharacterized protein LOC133325663 [Musca vetustissima]|uniref:uncharacterized protein LOC133325663 n=1 Tax=Musca vetustissima TaxID=27455 RepID=UPI002AB6115E|nr:uncharacterized protein LOC133325663 [Musca vetustissima]